MNNINPSLKLAQLKKLAEILNLQIPSTCKTLAKIKEHLSQANIPVNQFETAQNQILDQDATIKKGKKSTKSTKNSMELLSATPNSQPTISPISPNWMESITEKISQMENQINYLMQKVSVLERHITHVGNGLDVKLLDIDVLKSLILKNTTGNKLISTDDLIALPEIKPFPPNQIERAILDLVDDEYFDVSEGSSKWKLQGNIGLLIRRK